MKLIVNMGSVHEPLLDSSSLLQSGRFFTVGFYMRSVLDVQLLYYFVFFSRKSSTCKFQHREVTICLTAQILLL